MRDELSGAQRDEQERASGAGSTMPNMSYLLNHLSLEVSHENSPSNKKVTIEALADLFAAAMDQTTIYAFQNSPDWRTHFLEFLRRAEEGE